MPIHFFINRHRCRLLLVGLLFTISPQGLWAKPEEIPLVSTPHAVGHAETLPVEVPLFPGQKILESRCSTCHVAPAPKDHLLSEWPGILNRMGPMAFLSSADTQNVLAYVQAIQSGVPVFAQSAPPAQTAAQPTAEPPADPTLMPALESSDSP